MFIPLIAFEPVAAEAVRFPIRLFATVVVPPVVVGEVSRIPLTVAPGLVPQIVVFLGNRHVGQRALEIAVTAADPDDVIGSIRFPDTVIAPLVAFDEPSASPVIASPPVMLLIVLVATVVPAPLKLMLIIVIAPVGVVLAVMLLNVLLVIVLFAELVDDEPSLFDQPTMVVLPGTVMFEKLLRLLSIVEPVTEEPLAPKKVTVPPLHFVEGRDNRVAAYAFTTGGCHA